MLMTMITMMTMRTMMPASHAISSPQGFIVYSYAHRYAEGRAQMMKWVESGKLTARTTQYEGLAKAPQAFIDLLGGATVGTTVVNVR
jgi:NADPH-dependent curcumin reductase CurA